MALQLLCYGWVEFGYIFNSALLKTANDLVRKQKKGNNFTFIWPKSKNCPPLLVLNSLIRPHLLNQTKPTKPTLNCWLGWNTRESKRTQPFPLCLWQCCLAKPSNTCIFGLSEFCIEQPSSATAVFMCVSKRGWRISFMLSRKIRMSLQRPAGSS